MLDSLALPFMQRALVGGALVGILASYYGVFVVQRRLAFMGSGLAHAAFGGVALGILLGTQPLWIAVPFTAVVALLIVWVRERSVLAEDTSIGVFFAVSMALGIIFLYLKQGYTGDAFTYLFGSILAVTRADVVVTGIVVVATLLLAPCWNRWAYATFDRNLARSDRVPVAAYDYALAVAIAVSVVVSMKVVGIVLISAFLVLPAATARLMARSFAQMTVVSVLVGVISVVVGLAASDAAGLPSSATIVLLQSACFGTALGLGRLFAYRR